jgi:transcriptional regulator with XRE-family HTH domain
MADVAYIGPGGRKRRKWPLLRTLLGDVLRRRRLEQRRTLADVAGKARISMPYLSEVERGCKEASSEVLAAVCDALRIQLSDVLAEAGRDLAREQTTILRLETVRRRQAAATPPSRRPAVAPPGQRFGDVSLLAA